MKPIDIINSIIKAKGITKASVASRLGISPQALRKRIIPDNPGIITISDTLKAMDYKVVIMPREARLPKDSFEVTEI